ncbi:hypothetical protein I547_4346 [Mycobacterium kansasii 824]|nr:hypothetical protein I547_4346 [Mycobacterium kansasii 824]
MLHEFWENFTHNLFKPLLLFFYFGFLIPILKVRFEFPYVIYQGLTMYLLLAIGWHGGEELAKIKASSIGTIVGFMVLGFLLNFAIGGLAYLLLSRMSSMRRVDRATVAGYYGSDSAGTFATCVAVLTSVGIAFNAYMPVMLAVMEIPGCLVALYLVARLRHRGMDEAGYMPDEPGYTPRPRSHSGREPRRGRPAGKLSKPPTTAESSRSWSSRWKSRSIRTGRKPGKAAARHPCSRVSCCRKSSSTLGCVCCSAASSSDSSADYKERKSSTTMTPSSSRPSRAYWRCSCSRWA